MKHFIFLLSFFSIGFSLDVNATSFGEYCDRSDSTLRQRLVGDSDEGSTPKKGGWVIDPASAPSAELMSEEDKRDHVFFVLGKAWELFKLKEYDEAYYQLNRFKDCDEHPKSQYILGEYYEKGLGRINAVPEDALKYYMKAASNEKTRKGSYLHEMALEGALRVLEVLKEKRLRRAELRERLGL